MTNYDETDPTCKGFGPYPKSWAEVIERDLVGLWEDRAEYETWLADGLARIAEAEAALINVCWDWVRSS